MQVCVLNNLKKGIEIGLYREGIDLEFTSRIYFNGMVGIKNIELFPLTDYSMNTLMNHYLEYHIRGIASEKGVQELKKQLIQK